MENQLVIIDNIQSKSEEVEQISDQLAIEWFEIRKQKITRKTTAGLTLELRLQHKNEWQNGDRLFQGNKLIASVYIKPCLCIQFSAISASDAADFCYFVGNRHLPIYWGKDNNNQLLLPYDGRMYDQLLVRYQDKIQLVEEQLTSKFLLKNLVKN
ncbi:urease accessory protein UreE [Empedobacter brevis]|uniref:urease accessory protein UreE n=1 Tax=Empedobacter brevis TaxID=247 RepID=UPI0039AFD9AF